MANRRCFQALTRLLCTSSPQSFKTLKPHHPKFPQISPPIPHHLLEPSLNPSIFANLHLNFTISRHFSSNHGGRDDGSDEESDDEEGESEEGDGDDDENVSEREYSLEERESEAAAIGYKVIGPLEQTDRIFKPYEPVFAVVQIGSHQFKVSNGDCIYTERLKFCDVHDKIILSKVLMLGSRTQTMIGRPVLPDAAVHAIVEEHALDAKVIIFKKKRRKNYRRTRGHRQELTKLRITDIQGIEKPETANPGKQEKTAPKKVEKVAVAA